LHHPARRPASDPPQHLQLNRITYRDDPRGDRALPTPARLSLLQSSDRAGVG
jgi:hypothetical protein